MSAYENDHWSAPAVICPSLPSRAQSQEVSYTLELLKAAYIDSTNPKEIILIFKHTTKSDEKEKIIISGKITYSLADSAEKTEIIGRNNQHGIIVDDRNIQIHKPNLYALIKGSDKIDTTSNFRFLIFYLRNITDKYVDRMKFTYGLWEPSNPDVRIETTYDIKIDQ